MQIEQLIATELRLKPEQVKEALALLKEGGAVPFIAQFRREQTGQLDERKLYAIQDKLRGQDELNARRSIILNSINAQEKLDPALRARIEAVTNRADLEDLYLPYGPEQKSAASSAKEKGLEPLAELILKQETTSGDPEALAAQYLSSEKGVKEVLEALNGARAIAAAALASDPELRKATRKRVRKEGLLIAEARKGADLGRTKYKESTQPANKVTASKLLPLLRGVTDRKLVLKIQVPREAGMEEIKSSVITKPESIFSAELEKALAEALDKQLFPSFETEYLDELTARAEQTALEQSTRNLRAMLLHPPLGLKPVLAIAGEGKKAVGFAALDSFGKVLKAGPFSIEEDPEKQGAAGEELVKLIAESAVDVIVIGNGPSGRRVKAYVGGILKAHGLERIGVALISEVGLSAAANTQPIKEEMKDLDAAARCAALLGRRIQDPLPEFIKVNPKLLISGVSQHASDANLLRRKLEETVSSCVNLVGVNVNTADARLLEYVAGLNAAKAKAILAARQENGAFKSREELKSVRGIDENTFTQCAAFLRVKMGSNPLDDTAIHPEQYALVQKMADSIETRVEDLAGNSELLKKIDMAQFKSDQVSEASLRHILRELRLHGHDLRGPFLAPRNDSRIQSLADVEAGQTLTGLVSNHSAFGVFVDIGIAEEGLVHVTEISRKHLHDPARYLPVGKLTRVKVISIEAQKKRISLSIKALEDEKRERRGEPRSRRRDEGVDRATTPVRTETATTAARTEPAATAAPTEPATTATRTERKEGGRGPGGEKGGRGRRGGAEKENREAAKYSKVSPSGKPMPDFSKFFAGSSKKKDNKKKTTSNKKDGASRNEILEVIRNQASRAAPTLGDLLKKAGVKEMD